MRTLKLAASAPLSPLFPARLHSRLVPNFCHWPKTARHPLLSSTKDILPCTNRLYGRGLRRSPTLVLSSFFTVVPRKSAAFTRLRSLILRPASAPTLRS